MRFTIERKNRIDWLWSLGLVTLGVVSRLPFVSHILYHWDSINFALAIRRYDITHHQPQPPGYILYVLLARGINTLVANPQWTLVGMSILGGILAAVILYLLGRDLFDRTAGVVAALFLLFCPLFWFYSEIAMPYIIDGLATIALAWLFNRAEQLKRSFLPAAVLLGVVGGFRQQTMVFMAPLAVYAMRKASIKQMVLGASTAVIVFLGSFIPMIGLSGGWQAYRQAVSGLTGSFFTQTSVLMGGGLRGLAHDVASWGSSTAYALGPIGVILFIWAVWKIREFPALLQDRRAWFLAMWILPSLTFYTFIHMGSHGLVFTYIPAVFLISAKASCDLVKAVQERWRARLWTTVMGGILLADVLMFVVLSNKPLAGMDFKIVNWATIRANDRFFSTRFQLIQDHFDPGSSVILASTWRHLQYYLPQYYVLSSPCGSSELTLETSDVVYAYGREYNTLQQGDLNGTLPASSQIVIFFDNTAECFLTGFSTTRIQTLSLEGENVYYLRLDADETLAFNGSALVIHGK
jgi:hypothetical protein